MIQASAIKKAESSDDLVLRLYNPVDQRRASLVSFPAHNLELTVVLEGFEVQTYLVNLKTGNVTKTNLIEDLIL